MRQALKVIPALALGLTMTGCAAGSAIVDSPIHATTRMPLVAERLPLPGVAVAIHVTPQGEGLIALSDGRILSVSVAGQVGPVDPVPGEVRREGTFAFADVSATTSMAIAETGVMRIEHGLLNDDARARGMHGARVYGWRGAHDAIWATTGGLFSTWGDQVVEVQSASGSIRGVAQIVPFLGDTWIRTGPRVQRLKLARAGDGSPRVTWLDAAPGTQLGAVRSIARLDATHGVVASDRGVTLVSSDAILTFHGEPGEGAPDALGGGGGWAWVGWDGAILRTDGRVWEALVSGVALGPNARIAVDEGTGASALVLDGAGRVVRVVAEDALRTSGVTDGASVFDTRLELEVVPGSGRPPRSVSFLVDGSPLGTRTAAPWGWGDDGARLLDVDRLSFGAHRFDVTATYEGGVTRRRSIRIEYGSPLGRVPSYAKDVSPLYAARCSRCHSGGVARDLSGYGRLSSQAAAVRASIREGRMPPDIKLDAASAAMFTSWIDGAAPP